MAHCRIAVVGGINMDLIFETDRMPECGDSLDASSLVHLPGGKGANTAVAVHRASHIGPDPRTTPKLLNAASEIKVYMNGAIGNDSFGPTLLNNLSTNGIDVTGVKTVQGQPSGTCCVFVEKGDSRNIGYEGANLQWTPPDHAVQSLAGGQKPDLVITHLGIPVEVIDRVLTMSHQQGVETLLNPSPVYNLPDELYENITHLILNQHEAAVLSGLAPDGAHQEVSYTHAALRCIEKGVQNVVITLGKQGAFFMTKDLSGMVKAEQNVRVVDTTGAGDTFVGNYAVERVRQKQIGKWDIEQAVTRACKASAHTIGRLGAQAAIPWENEIIANLS